MFHNSHLIPLILLYSEKPHIHHLISLILFNLNCGKYKSILSNEFVTDIFLLKLLTLIYLNAVLSTFKHLSNVIYLQSFSVQNLRLVQIKTTVHWFCDSFTIVNIVKVYFTSIIYCISQSADSFPT